MVIEGILVEPSEKYTIFVFVGFYLSWLMSFKFILELHCKVPLMFCNYLLSPVFPRSFFQLYEKWNFYNLVL